MMSLTPMGIPYNGPRRLERSRRARALERARAIDMLPGQHSAVLQGNLCEAILDMNSISPMMKIRHSAQPGQHALHAARIILASPPPSSFHHLCICSNCVMRRLISLHRDAGASSDAALAEALINSGLRRSSGVMELMMPSVRRVAFSCMSGEVLRRLGSCADEFVHQ